MTYVGWRKRASIYQYAARRVRSEAPFGRWQGIAQTGVDSGGHAYRAAERLEYGFRNMMAVGSAQVVDVQGCLRVVNEALEEFMKQVDFKIPDMGPRKCDMVFQARPAGKIDHDP